MTMTFRDFFSEATGHGPYPYQEAFAAADPLPHLVRAPTGSGKTAVAILGWLWRYHQDPRSTPRRLVYCLPMRVLVEQACREAQRWCDALKDVLKRDVAVHVLMGGAESEAWFLRP